MFRAAPPGSKVSPNLAGRDAAAFAMCYQVFRELGSRGSHDDACSPASTSSRWRTRSPTGHLLTLMPFGFYPETEWRDDLELGATELAMALAAGGLPDRAAAHAIRAFYLSRARRTGRKAYIAGRATRRTR